MLVGDYASARVILQNFFAGPFMDQLAASGEQPFEAVRTRPYHYRCFNLEALIVIIHNIRAISSILTKFLDKCENRGSA